MVFGKLFKNKDKYGIREFLNNTKLIQKDINKYKSGKVEMTINDVVKIIQDIKSLNKQSKQIIININNADIDDKEKEIKIQLLSLKFDEIKRLNDKVIVYEKQLQEYKKIVSNKK